MPTIEVTEEQYDELENLKETISEEVVGPYGQVRMRDAVQYLIDNIDISQEAVNSDSTTTRTDTGVTVVDKPPKKIDPGEISEIEIREALEEDTEEKEDTDEESETESEADADPDTDTEQDILDEYPDKWYVPDSDTYKYAGKNPNDNTQYYKTEDGLKEALRRWYNEDGKKETEDETTKETDITEEYSGKWEENGGNQYSYAVETPGESSEEHYVEDEEELRDCLKRWYGEGWDVLEEYDDRWEFSRKYNEFYILFPDDSIKSFGTSKKLAEELQEWFSDEKEMVRSN